MAKAIRKNLEDIALPAVPQATPGLNIPIDFFIARGRGARGGSRHQSRRIQAERPR